MLTLGGAKARRSEVINSPGSRFPGWNFLFFVLDVNVQPLSGIGRGRRAEELVLAAADSECASTLMSHHSQTMVSIAPFLVIGGFVALVGGIFYLAGLTEKKRIEAMTAFARNHGYVFEGTSPQLIDELAGFKLFNQGSYRTAKNVMRGSKDSGAVRICDYQFITGFGQSHQMHQLTICVLKTPGRMAPHFFLRRQRSFFDAPGKVFGGQDINFEDDPIFSKAYVLQTSDDENQLRGFMSVGLRETLLRMVERNIMMEVMGDTLILHRGKRLKPDQLEALVADAVNICRQWS